jgi:hypothetical protein
MDIDEFIDTYSDDVLYIYEGRSALLTHPLRAESKEYLDASTCRLLAVFMIGSIEAMLAAWRDRDHIGILDVYFADRVPNGEKVSRLYDAFRGAGIHVDKEIFDDYLAIKYLRNTIVHHEWKEHEKDWLDKCGFPTDARNLTKEHLDRIERVNQNMMFYVFLTSSAPTVAKPEKLIKLDETLTRRTDETGILRRGDIDRIIWNNLQRIDAFIYVDIERAATSEAYDWTAGRSRTELEGMGSEERKRLFYLAARRAGEEDHQSLARHRALAREALAFWHEYWQRAVTSRGLQEVRIEHALEVLQGAHFARLATKAPWNSVLESMPDDTACRLVDAALESDAPFTSKQVVNALRAGHLAWELIPNIMPVTLFTLRLPIVDPANTAVYLGEADRALRVFRLNRTWYHRVEPHRPPAEEGLDFYDRMHQELAMRPSGNGA